VNGNVSRVVAGCIMLILPWHKVQAAGTSTVKIQPITKDWSTAAEMRSVVKDRSTAAEMRPVAVTGSAAAGGMRLNL